MNRQILIQKLINKINAQSYLEIGLGGGDTYKNINCKKIYGVDPCYGTWDTGQDCSAEPTHKMTSDQFFKENTERFDVIFIDGLHEADTVERDINNALDCLNSEGYIVCHDMNPLSKGSQEVPRVQVGWHGDCWKAWVRIRQVNPDINMCVISADCGLGVIQKGSQELLDVNGLEIIYENLEFNRKLWLNLISPEEFLDMHELR